MSFTPVPVVKEDIRIFREMDLKESDYDVEKYRVTFDRQSWMLVAAEGLGSESALALPTRESAVNLLLLTQKTGHPAKAVHFVVSSDRSSVYSYFYYDPGEFRHRNISMLGGRFILTGVGAGGPSDVAYRLQLLQSDVAPKGAKE